MADMILKLNGPGMTSLHKAGLAGLYMTLKAFERNKIRIDELDWELHPDRVVLDWQGETPKAAFRQLIERSFQIDHDGFFRFAGLNTGSPATVDQKHLLYMVMLNTFLQYGKHCKKNAARPLIYQIDEKTKIYDAEFKPVISYQHQYASDDFLNRSGAFRPDVGVIGWLYPGGGQRHAQHSNSVLTSTVLLNKSRSSTPRHPATWTLRQSSSEGARETKTRGGDRPRHVTLHGAKTRAGGSAWVGEAL